MLTQTQFLDIVLFSFKSFVDSGSSRSTAKPKPLHGAMAADLSRMLGNGYKVFSQGYGEGTEEVIAGRYIEKRVDIAVLRETDGKAVAGIGVKFVMQNYSQNSNNYFENMLGETANIRAALVPYFQVFVILDRLPYYKKTGEITKWEEFTRHNIQKYCILAEDNSDQYPHTPNKTLICVAHISPVAENVGTRDEYMAFYRRNADSLQVSVSPMAYPALPANGTIIMNDYPAFINKVYHTILSL